MYRPSPIWFFPGWRKAVQSGRRFERNPTDEWSDDISGLPPDLQDLWMDTYDVALAYYTAAPDGGFPKFAKGTAWHAVEWRMRQQQNPPQQQHLRRPEQLVVLAKMLEFVSVENAPQLTVVRFGPRAKNPKLPENSPVQIYHVPEEPDLLWEHDKKYLLAIPGRDFEDLGACRIPDRKKRAYKTFKTFTKQKPLCEKDVDIPKYLLVPVGIADTVVYRSTKWTKDRNNIPGAQEYIHQFGPAVMAETTSNADAFVFEGGKLDMIAAGIIN